MVTKAFDELQLFKPFYGSDPDRVERTYDMLLSDVKDMPEAAVLLACDDLRYSESKWFPTTEIVKYATEYRDMIYSALDYFQQGEK